MKKQKPERAPGYGRLFQEAERLEPTPQLWERIAERLELRPGRAAAGMVSWPSPFLRLAASVVLAVGLLGLGIFLKAKPKQVAASPAASASAMAESAEQLDLVDPDLLGWHADLGEVDMEAEEAEEVL